MYNSLYNEKSTFESKYVTSNAKEVSILPFSLDSTIVSASIMITIIVATLLYR